MRWSLAPRTIGQVLRQRSAEEGKRAAYTFLAGGEVEARLTYAELDHRARAVGASLQAAGATGERVILLFPPGLDFIVAFFGSLYAGCVAVPALPPRRQGRRGGDPRLQAILQDARPCMALTSADRLPALESAAAEMPELRAVRWSTLSTDGAAEWREPVHDPDALAFLQYTSGSTASPKGVMISHRNLLHNEEMIRLAFGQSSESVIVGWLPLYHDMGLIGNVLQTVYVGGSCVLMSPAAFLQRPLRWLEAIDRYRATTSGGPNFAYDLCARRALAGPVPELDLSSWTVAFNGAEPVRAETLDRFCRVFEPHGFRRAAFYPCYGLAEATLFVSGATPGAGPRVARLDTAALERHEAVLATNPGDAGGTALVGCGRSWLEQEIAIVDPATSERRTEGGVGEIWVSGPGVAQGYWNQPVATAEIFNARLAGAEEDSTGRRFLRTGDLGFFRGGELFITGRIKDLVIIRGRNHYPQDIELTAEGSHIALKPGGGAAFSVDVVGEERLVVVQEVEQRADVAPDAVCAAVRQAIVEEHEVQVHEVVLIRVGTLPKTSSGKVQRHSARAAYLYGTLHVVARSAVAVVAGGAEAEGFGREHLLALPPGERLDALCGILTPQIARLTGAPPVDLAGDPPLAALGLDSLAAIQLGHTMETALGVSVSMTDLLDRLTVSGLALKVFERLDQGTAEARPGLIREGGTEGVHPTTYGQRALWFLERMGIGGAYNIVAVMRLRSAVGEAELRAALRGLVRRHPALRTTFEPADGAARQRVHAWLEPGFAVEEAGEVGAWSAAETEQWIAAAAYAPFDLEHGPLLRLRLLRRGGEDPLLVLAVHHTVSDFWSLGVMVRDFAVLAGGQAPPLEPALRASDFARFQERLLAGPEGERLWNFWRAELAGQAPVLDLPMDRPRPPLQTYRGAARPLRLGRELSARLLEAGRDAGATLFMTLLAAFQTLLHRYSGQDVVVCGSPTAGRTAAELAPVVGYFVNPVVLRGDLSGEPSFTELLGRVRRAALAAFAYQEMPFALLAERLQPQRDLSRPPLFQVMFLLQKAHDPELRALDAFALREPGHTLAIGDLVLESVELTDRRPQFDLALTAVEVDGEVRGSLEYNADLFDAPTMGRLLGHFATLLHEVADAPQRLLRSLPLLAPAERAQLLTEWNDTAIAGLDQTLVHRQLEAQAAHSPDAVAVVCGSASVTYAELERRVNRMARHLRAMGLSPEARVGVCLDRSPGLLVALFGILKAGGAYVPLDPMHPKERLAFIVADAGVDLLVTEERWVDRFQAGHPRSICLDAGYDAMAAGDDSDLPAIDLPDPLAYLMYTSGSTGQPKGVMVCHRSVANFFAAMDRLLGCEPARWLAVTSFSFDISVLELLWTLCRGHRVVVQRTNPAAVTAATRQIPQQSRPIDFSLFYFASDEGEEASHKYRLLLAGAKFADQHGFAAVWTPERHFHAFGGLYPNPSVTAAAVAAVTDRVKIRAGSVVLPLHHPIRVAEEWSVVDNLSQGRAGISFASGWNARDFVFSPESYAGRRELLAGQVDTVRRLWRGETVRCRGPAGEVEVRVLPRPVQSELPVWLTAAGNPDTFRLAGELGTGVLTHLLGQSARDLAERIALYRQAWRAAGHAGDGHVVLMLHAFVGRDVVEVRETVRSPFTRYLASSLDLMKVLAPGQDLDAFTEEDRRVLLDQAFERYFETSGLFGTPETCLRTVEKLRGLGVDEIACLIDFGVPVETTLEGLRWLAELRERSQEKSAAADVPESIPALVVTHAVNHLQCTPSAVTALLADTEAAAALARLDRLLVGGEALPLALAERVRELLRGELLNMYGPTETTIWSSIDRVDGPVTLGQPIANTALYVLDTWLEPVPIGQPGELFIGGLGVVRGYQRRPGLTAERFLPDPFSVRPGGRIYRTGDLVRRLPDGRLAFLGRTDHQVKLRGHRIELGEIEAVLTSHPAVREAVVVAREEVTGDLASQRLVAYLVPAEPAAAGEIEELSAWVAERLPAVMLPAAWVVLSALPLTPNGKVDRKALPAPQAPSRDQVGWATPETATQLKVARVWSELLRLDAVGLHDNFFALGGHSLLATQVVAHLQRACGVTVSLQQLFRAPTVAALAAHIDAARGAGRVAELPPMGPVARDGDLPLSFAQERLWFIDRLAPGAPVYNMPVGLRLRGPLDLAGLVWSLTEIVRRHEALRTVFPEVAGCPVQLVQPAVPSPMTTIDLTGLAGSAATAGHLAAAEARRPFDLETGPLLRALLLRSAPEEHLLVLVLHHAVADGWSLGVLLAEMEALYAAFAAGRPSPLPELAVQYPDHAVWQRRRLSGTELESLIDHWRQALAGAPEALDLPTDRPRPAMQAYRGGVVRATLDAGLVDDLRGLARREGATLFMVLLGGLAALLERYTGQDDLVIGSPVANRDRAEIEGLIGFFVNALPLRVELTGDSTVGELLARVRERVVDSFAHQEVPFERLVEALQPRRDLSRSPLFQVMLAEEGAPAAPRLPGVAVELLGPERLHTGTAKFDLTLSLAPGPDGLAGVLEYDSDLFEAATARRLFDHWSHLLRDLAATPSRRFSELSMLGEAELRQLLEWSRTATPYPREATLHSLFRQQAIQARDAVAVVCGESALSYGELARRAVRLARQLRALGVGPEVRVGLCVERSLEMIVGLLGILESGGAYLPLDPSYPSERLAWLLADACPKVLLVQGHLEDRLPQSALQRVRLNGGSEPCEDLPALGPVDEVGPESLAYVMYTSGSTGRPKGVGVPHRGVVRLVRDTGYASFGPREVLLQYAPLAFDASTLEIWGALLHGARLVIFDGAQASTEDLDEALARHGVTTLWLTAGLFHQVVEQRVHALRPVRQLLAGGDALSPWHVKKALAELAGCRLINGYGPTENTTFTCCHELSRGEEVGASVPIGRPIANTDVHLLDFWGGLLPAGVAGELCAGGDGLARGYLGRPDLTAERWVPDAVSGRAGARLYRTGDRARQRGDGVVEFLGRLDQQVKIRGFRVEPGEIEAALAGHSGVREAAVTVRVGTGEASLMACVVTQGTVTPSREELRQFLRQSLPEHLVPPAWVFLPTLPLTPQGKVDRRALAHLELSLEPSARFVPPRTPAEELLAGAWAELLEAGQVGATDDFFASGGHSLLATRLVARVRALFGVELPLRTMFQEPTLAGMAAAIERARGEGLRPAAPPVVPVPRQGDLPLSFAQERLWFLDRLSPGTSTYNVPVGLWLRGALDLAALARSLAETVRRHEALRTVFPEVGGRPVQLVQLAVPLPMAMVDLTGLASSAATAGRLATEEACRPFDLRTGPLLRALLLRCAPEEHLLILVLHHVITDGWSMRVLLVEMEALYAAFAASHPSPLPQLAVQYPDYAVWQRRRLSDQGMDSLIGWWRQTLAGAPEALDLPTGRPRPALQAHRGGVVRAALDGRLVDDLRGLARREGVTLFMVLLGGLAALLERYTGQDDLVIGSPVANRDRAEIEGLIGFFVNTLPLRVALAGDLTGGELLARVRERVVECFAHQEVPFERLVEALRPQRDLSRSPLFQVMLAVEDGAPAAPLLPRVAAELLAPERLHTGAAKFDLTLSLAPGTDGLAGMLEYDSALFEAATVLRLLDHWTRLLRALAETDETAAPSRRLSELPLLGEAERRQILDEWNETATPYPCDLGLYELFEAQAARTPEAVAVVWGKERVSYRELEKRAERVAGRLRRLRIGPERLVGIFCRRTPALVSAILGVLKAGGAYLPLDPAYPRQRLEDLLADSGAPVVLASAELAGALPSFGGEMVLVEEAERGVAAGSVLRGFCHPEQMAYAIYTSGSTGRPKAVAIRHAGAVARVCWALEIYPRQLLSGVLASTSICFDLSVFELFVPLAAGGTVILADDALALPELSPAAAVTLINTVPSAMAELVRSGWVPSSVRGVNLAGEPLRRELADRLYALPGIEEVWNLYGPSEDTTYSTGAPVERGALEEPAIGRPLANGRAYVVDGLGQPVPVGVPGELWLGGAGVARGYLNRAELTAERFVPDPFSGEPGGRLYRTGDLARWRRSGDLEFLGRLDHQVKVRGFRIEPGEIETVLLRHAGVAEAVVAVREDRPGDRRLVAYVVPAPGTAAAPDELRSHLGRTLPEHMVPESWVVLAALPRTPNGKVDRKGLPAPEAKESGAGYVAPRTPMEELLAGSWAELLGVERVGALDDFFALGGHSLLAARVVARVRALFGVELPLRTTFQEPTLAGLAAAIERARGEGRAPAAPPVVPVPRLGDLPLSFSQERLWFLDQLSPGTSTYNVPVGLRLRGALDLAALALSLAETVRRHEALRTVFPEVGGRPVQLVQASVPLPMATVDLTGLADSAVTAGHLALEEARRPFDLRTGPLLRALLLRCAPEEHLLVLVHHHVITDGWSMGVLLVEMESQYAAFAAGRPSPLPELAVQYSDYAVWQRRRLSDEWVESLIGWWRQILVGAPEALDLPTDRPRPAMQAYRGGVVRAALDRRLVDDLRGLARREGVTLFMVLLGGLAALLERYTGQDDLVIGSPVANRDRVEVEGLIGFFVNTLPLRVALAGDLTGGELLAGVRERVVECFAHQEVPFERLVEALRPQRDLSRSPLFQVMLAVEDGAPAAPRLPGVAVELLAPERLHTGTAKFDLTLSLTPGPDGLVGVVVYDLDLFEAATARRLLGHWAGLLRALAETDETVAAPSRLSDLPLLAGSERHQLLYEWNDTGLGRGSIACIHELFELQAQRTPDALALEAGGEQLTYRELSERSNRLAYYLQRRGMAPESRVALCLPRSAGLIVAMLGILKAGGAYVPLDPAYPRQRMHYVLDETGASILLTDESLRGSLPENGREVIQLDLESQQIASMTCGNPEPLAIPGNLAYVLYTSGSSGRPKGVMVEHRSVVNLVAALRDTVYRGSSERLRVAINAPLVFDAAVKQWVQLLCGHGLCIVPEEVRPDSGRLLSYLRDHAVEVLDCTPSQLSYLVEAGLLHDPVALDRVLVGGEQLPDPLWKRLAASARPAFFNVYGPTECTVDAAVAAVRPADGRSVLGRPIPNVRIHLLDPALQPVPIGVPGEICIGGAGLGRGYLGQPNQTAERFVPDPWANEPGKRLYRSGDLARNLPDGTLEFLRRIDRQVKIRGMRMELGEIESVLAEYPGVREVAVLAPEDERGERRLVAYLAWSQSPAPAPDGLRSFLRKRLPEYMVPAAFTVLETLPRTHNGKIDRAALQPLAPVASLGCIFVPPRTPAEEMLAGVWAEVLGIERVGIHDSFFDLGGHSLLATRIVSRLRSSLGVELPLRRLFETPTVAELAGQIETAGQRTDLPAIEWVDRGELLPLSFAQERLWVLDRLEPGNAAFGMPTAVRLRGQLRVEALQRSLEEVVARHEVLRTTFTEVAGEPRQRVGTAGPVPLPRVDLSGLPETVGVAELRRLEIEQARHAFDLSAGPLFLVHLVRLAAEEHALLLNIHHIVSDGWSHSVLVREVGALYAACIEGRPSPLSEPPVQYADYAAWQRRCLAGEALAAQLAYWRERLGGAPSLELPLDRPRPTVQTFRGVSQELRLPVELSAGLRRLARQEGTTLFMALLAAFQGLLSRWSGQDDVLVGTPIAGRRRSEVEGLIGCFLNTLVLRTDLSGRAGFRELLARVRETCLEAYAHQDVPFERLLEELVPSRDLSRTPLFQIFFNMLNLPERELQLPGLQLELEALPELPAKFDLTLYVSEPGERIGLNLVYNADLFAAERMEELLDQYELLLDQVVTAPERPIGLHTLVTERVRGLLPDPAAELAASWEGPVHASFARWGQETPEALAVFDAVEVWSYGGLLQQSRRLAHALAAAGVGRGDVVAVWTHRSAAVVWGVLGVLEAGAAFLLLDPAYPTAQLAERVRRARPRAWLQVEAAGPLPAALEQLLAGLACPRLGLPARAQELGVFAEWPAGPLEIEIRPEDLAYVAFTSGSTGEPKGILGSHRPLSHFLAWHTRTFDLQRQDRCALLSGLSHDPLLRDLFTPLVTGAALAIPEPELFADPGRLLAWLARERIRVIHLTSALGQMLALAAARDSGAVLPDLRRAFFGGDVLMQRDVARWRELAPAVSCVSFYGATETPQAMGWREVPDDGVLGIAVPLGRGIDEVQLLVLSPAGGLAGVGELGEVCVRTPHLALGYLDEPELTAERFPVNPFTERTEDRLYRTGDLGRYLPGGEVAFAGRADGQVKIRGFRVETGEVESALAGHSGVRAAAVVARDGDGERYLAAYVVPVPDGAPGPAELRTFLRERLPDYMIPAAFVVLERLPLTPNGKLDRRTLPAPERAAGGAWVAPRGPVEETLAGIWVEVLGVERLGALDDFFALGGHSLLATRLLFQVNNALRVELGLRSLFAAPTLAGMAAEVARQRDLQAPADSESLPMLRLAPQDRHLPFPLTPIQQAYWVGRTGALELGNVASHRYLEIEGEGLVLERFERAWQRLVDRHGMLRAVFLPNGTQQILPEVPPYRIEVEDLRELPAAGVEERLAASRDRMSHQVLAIDQWPLFEIRAFRLSGERLRIAISFDYLIADAWSFRLLSRELVDLYRGAAPAPPLELSFRDYVLTGQELRGTGLYRRSQVYWQDRLADLPPGPELSLVASPATLDRQVFVRRRTHLAAASWHALKGGGLRCGVTPSALLLTAFGEVLGTWSKSPRFTLVLTLFNRLPLHPEVNQILGDFTSTTLLAMERSPEEPFVRRARNIQEQLWRDLDHRFMSGVEVLRELTRVQERSAPAALPVVFTSTLDLQSVAGEGSDAGAGPRAANVVYSISQTPQVILDHQAGERNGELFVNWDAVEDLFPAGMLDEMFTAYCELLRRLADDPEAWDRPLQALVPDHQLASRMAANATASPVPPGLLHEPFLEQARREPGRPAVIASGRRLTYGELDRRSARLGWHLRRLGARSGELVAVVMDKGWEQMVAVLATLRAGAAYLPVDPALPQERIDYLLQHGEARLALTQPALADALAWPAGVEVLTIDAEEPEEAAAEPLEAVQEPGDLAYVIFTSGSTGLPKGVMIDHRGALNTVADVNRRFQVGPQDRVLALSALNFDLSVWDIFGLLAAGGAVVLPDASAAREPALWRELIASEGVTVWNTVPALMSLLVGNLEETGATLPPPLRLVLLSGDWIPIDLPGRIRRLSPAVKVISLGGATEASIWSILHPIGEVDPRWRSIPYGRPMTNQSFHVLDDSLLVRPDWVPGQLFIGGVGLAHGYWRDETKTAASFLVHSATGERLYRTGDLGRYLPDGAIEFLGREDFQVKVQGYRIELGEIEAALLRHPSVQAAAVAALGRRQDDQTLVAWVVPVAGGEVDAGELRQFLRAKLPAYMVPATFVALAEMPLTANGKLDRRALPVPGRETAVRRDYAPPRTPVEEELAKLFAEALQTDRVGIHDHFFESGGNSLKAILLISRVRKGFEVELPLARLFEKPTVEEIALAILEVQGSRVQDREMETMLSELEALSDEEIRNLLASEAEHA